MHPFRAAIALTAALALAVLPACGDDDEGSDTTAAVTTAAAPTASDDGALSGNETDVPLEATSDDALSVTDPGDETAGDSTGAENDANGADTAAAGPDEAEARAAIQGYLDAFVSQDGGAACELLTPTVQDAFLEAVKAALPDADTCEEAFTAAAGQAGDAGTEAIGSAKIGTITVNGDSAEGALEVLGTSVPIMLERIDGEWKIANMPGQ